MDKNKMIEIAKATMAHQDVGEVEAQLALYAKDCTFKMPTNREPMRGLAELRKSVEAWPKAITEPEWFVVEGSRLAAGWNWRGLGWPAEVPLLRGISTFVFNDDGLIQHYEDVFDPDWRTRHTV